MFSTNHSHLIISKSDNQQQELDMISLRPDWRNRCRTVVERNLFLLDTGYWTDVTFLLFDGNTKVDNAHIIKAHSHVLVTSSPVFETYLWQDLSIPIEIYDTEKDVFTQMLRFIYSDDCCITESNCLLLLQAANNYKVTGLRTRCLDYACKHTDAVISDVSILRLSKPTLEDLLMCDTIFVHESDLLVAVLLWAREITLQLQFNPGQETVTGCTWTRDWADVFRLLRVAPPKNCETYDPHCNLHGMNPASIGENISCSCPFTDIKDVSPEPLCISNYFSIEEIISGVDITELRKTLGNLLHLLRYPTLSDTYWQEVLASGLLTNEEAGFVTQVRSTDYNSQPWMMWPCKGYRLKPSLGCWEMNAPQSHTRVFPEKYLIFGLRYDSTCVIEGFRVWSDNIYKIYYKYNTEPSQKNYWRRLRHKTVELPGRDYNHFQVMFQEPLTNVSSIHFMLIFMSKPLVLTVAPNHVENFYTHCLLFAAEKLKDLVTVGTMGYCPIKSLFFKRN